MRERAKRKRPCRCPGDDDAGTVTVACHWGNCTEWRCHACGKLRFSAGPVWCPCDGYLRWMRHPGMDNPYKHWSLEADRLLTLRAAVKPSRARRFQGGRHNRKRKLYCERL